MLHRSGKWTGLEEIEQLLPKGDVGILSQVEIRVRWLILRVLMPVGSRLLVQLLGDRAFGSGIPQRVTVVFPGLTRHGAGSREGWTGDAG